MARPRVSGALAIVRQAQPLSSWGWAALERTKASMGAAWVRGIWTSGRTTVRGASAREFDQQSPAARGQWLGTIFTGPLSWARVHEGRNLGELPVLYQAVVPVAEETGVRIGIHPDDPPVPVLAGVEETPRSARRVLDRARPQASTSRTLRARTSGEKGFVKKCTPGSRIPCRAIASSV